MFRSDVGCWCFTVCIRLGWESRLKPCGAFLRQHGSAKIWLVSGVFLGTYLWWGVLSVIANLMKGRQKKGHFQTMKIE